MQILTEADIKDLSKRDAFTKAFACIQSLWLVIQCIARAVDGLPITQLELATIAFVVCGILMYLLWWDKPFGIERRQTFVATVDDERLASREVTASDMELKFHAGPPNSLYSSLSLTATTEHENVRSIRETRVHESSPMDLMLLLHYKNVTKAIYTATRRLLGSSTELVYPIPIAGATIAFYVSGTLFSSFHLLAWDWDFPTPSARIAWRTFALAATCANPAIIFFLLLDDIIVKGSDFLQDVWTYLFLSLAFVYFLARLGLIVLVFYCFSSMPAEVYQTVGWTKIWPHFS